MPRQHFTGESEAFAVFPKAPDPGMGRSCAPVWPPEVLWATWAGPGRPQTGLCPLPASGPACSRLRPQSRVPQPPGSPPRPCRGRLGWAPGDPAHAGRLPLTRKPKESFGGRSPRARGRRWAPRNVDFIPCLPGSRDARRGHVATSSVTRKAVRVSFQLDSRRARRPDRTRIRVTWRRPDVTGAVNADHTRLGSGNRTAFEADAGAASAPRSPRVGGALGPSAHWAAPRGRDSGHGAFLVRAPAHPARARPRPLKQLDSLSEACLSARHWPDTQGRVGIVA